MGKTVKQIADEIGVSKTAVRKYMDADFVVKYTTQEGERSPIIVSDEGVELLKTKCKGRGKFAEEAESLQVETANHDENTEEVIKLREQIAELKTELRIRRETESEKIELLKKQIEDLQAANERLQEQNNNLTNAVSAASASQAVQAANAKLLIEANTRRSFWSIFRKKKQPELEQVREEVRT